MNFQSDPLSQPSWDDISPQLCAYFHLDPYHAIKCPKSALGFMAVVGGHIDGRHLNQEKA